MKKNINTWITINIENETHCRALCNYCRSVGESYYCAHFDEDIPNLERARACIESQLSKDDDDLIVSLRESLAESDKNFKELHAKIETSLFVEDHRQLLEKQRKMIEWINSL